MRRMPRCHCSSVIFSFIFIIIVIKPKACSVCSKAALFESITASPPGTESPHDPCAHGSCSPPSGPTKLCTPQERVMNAKHSFVCIALQGYSSSTVCKPCVSCNKLAAKSRQSHLLQGPVYNAAMQTATNKACFSQAEQPSICSGAKNDVHYVMCNCRCGF